MLRRSFENNHQDGKSDVSLSGDMPNVSIVADLFDRPSSVTTAVRVRPTSVAEVRGEMRCITSVEGGEQPEEINLNLLDPTFFSRKRDYDQKYFERQFKYDYCFWQTSSQQLIYEKVGRPLLQHALDGFNCCILAYGQTGSGKTYTMIGEDSDSAWAGLEVGKPSDVAGVIPRLCLDLLTTVHSRMDVDRSSNSETDTDNRNANGTSRRDVAYRLIDAGVSASFYEIYNEKVHDLLAPRPEQPCRVREHPEDGAYIEALTIVPIENMRQASQVMAHGLKQRAVAETRMNAVSSRSHAVFTLYLRQKLSSTAHVNSDTKSSKDDRSLQRTSKITLVDLAGSERVSLTGASGERLVEANNINKSLSTLSDVIKALSDKGASMKDEEPLGVSLSPAKKDPGTFFVPYRNSILTWLLKDCLGGNSRTSMLATVGPTENAYNETMSTLRYIERAKLIMNTARINETSNDPAFIQNLHRQIAQLKERIVELNKLHVSREEEHRLELIAQEEELEKRFITQTVELRDELFYYKNSRSSSAPPSPDKDASGASSYPSIAEITLLKTELAQLKNINEQQTAIIARYEDSEGIVVGDSPVPNNRMKGIVLSYKKEKEIMVQQYEELMAKCKSLTHDVEGGREHIERIEMQKNSLTADLSLARADRNRLKSELAHRVEEINTKLSELEFYKNRLGNSVSEHKRKVALLEMHISKAKDAESALRHEKEADLDKFTELLAEKQKQVQDVDVRIADVTKIWTEKTEALDAKLKQATKEKERLRHQVQGKIEEIEIANLEASKLKDEIALLKTKETELRKCEHDLEESQLETKRKQSTLVALRSEFDEHKTLLLSEQKKLTDAYNLLGSAREAKEKMDRELSELKTDKASLQQQLEDLEVRRGKQFLDLQQAHELAMAKATEKITQLNVIIRERMSEIQQLEAEIKKWKELELSKEQELAMAKDKDSQLEKVVEALQKEVKAEKELEHQLEDRLHAEEAQEKALMTKLDETLSSYANEQSLSRSLQDKVASLENNLSTLEKQLSQATADGSRLAQEKSELDAALAEEKKALAASQVSVSELTSALSTSETALTAERSIVKELRDDVTRYEEKVRDAVSLIKSSTAKHDAEAHELQGKVASLENNLSTLEKQLSQATADGSRLAQEKSELDAALAEEKKALAASQVSVSELTSALSTSETALTAERSIVKELRDDVTRYEEKVRDAVSLIKSSTAKHDAEAHELQGWREKFNEEHSLHEAHMKSLADAQANVVTLRQQLDIASTQLQTANELHAQTISRLQSENMFNAEKEASFKQMERENHRLEALVQDNDRVVKHLVGKHEEELHELEALRKRIAREERERELMGGHKANSEVMINMLRSQVVDAEERVEMLESEKANMLEEHKAALFEAQRAAAGRKDNSAELVSLRKDLDVAHAKVQEQTLLLQQQQSELIEKEQQLLKKDSLITEQSARINATNVIPSSPVSTTPVKSPSVTTPDTDEKSDKKKKRSSIFRGAQKGWNVLRSITGIDSKKTDAPSSPMTISEVQETQDYGIEELQQQVQELTASLVQRDAELDAFRAHAPVAGQTGRLFKQKTHEWKTIHSMIRWQTPENVAKIADIIKNKSYVIGLQDPRSLNVPLHIAAQNGHVESTRLLLSAGADCNAKNCTGQTPLHMAMAYDYLEIVCMLREAGANDCIRNDRGFTAISGADGTKTTGLLSLSQARSQSNIQTALKEISTQIDVTDISEYVKTFLKSKRENVGLWGVDELTAFKDVFRRLGVVVPRPQPKVVLEYDAMEEINAKLKMQDMQLRIAEEEKVRLENEVKHFRQEQHTQAENSAKAAHALAEHEKEVINLKAEMSILQSKLSASELSTSRAAEKESLTVVPTDSEFRVHTHDDASLTEELIVTKMSLAVANSELEQIQFESKQDKRTIDELKELVNALRSEVGQR